MKWIKKELDAIPYNPYPDKCKPGNCDLVMLAEQESYQDTKILVATFYRVTSKQPYCRVYLSKDSFTTKLCETGKWSAATLEGLHLDGSWWTLDNSTCIHVTPQAQKIVNANTKDGYSNEDAIKRIDWHQCNIKRDKQIAKAKIRAAEDRLIIEEVSNQIPPLPDDFERQILDGPLADSRYIFYRTAKVRNPLSGLQERRVYGFCSNCMQEYELMYEPTHKERACWCPECECEAIAYKRGLGRSKLKAQCKYAVFATAGNNVFARFFEVTRDYSGDPENIKTHLCEVERYYFTAGAAYKLTRYWSNYFGSKYIGENWSVMRSIYEDIYDYDFYPYTEDLFRGTVLEHAHLDDYVRQAGKSNRAYLMQYLACYCREPSIEHLLGTGLIRFVQARVHHDAAANRAIDWKATRPRDMLGVSQPELEQIKALDMYCASFEAYKILKPAGVTLSVEDKPIVDFFAELGYHLREKEERPITVAKRWGLKETVRYLKYQHRRTYKGKKKYRDIWTELLDYHGMASELGYDLNDSYYLMPPNLEKAHDHAAELQLKMKELEIKKQAKAEKKQWDKLYNSLKPLEYTNGKLLIRPARNRVEIHNEGKLQKHCIAGYAKNMLNGESIIWFIRRTDQPNVPYYALNTSKAPQLQFYQCHGYENDKDLPGHTRPQEIKDFEAEWYKKVVKPWQKKQESDKIKALQSTAKKQTRERVPVGA